MEKKAAAKSWPENEVKALLAAYAASGYDNSKLGELMAGKTAAQCRSKLVQLKEYRKTETAAEKAGSEPARKVSIVKAIEIFAGVPAGSLETLEKAAKPQLELLVRRLTELSDQYNATIPAESDPARRAVNVDGYETADVADAVETNGM